MKRNTAFCVSMVFLILFLFSGRAQATWHWVHGSSGHVESGAVEKHTATGLLVYPPDETAWVHFQVPTIAETTQGARYIRIKFNLVNALDSAIKQVKIYNGGAIVKTFNVLWAGDGTETKTLDLGKVVSFTTGMGVSVLIDSGPDSLTDEYIFIGVGANFVPKP